MPEGYAGPFSAGRGVRLPPSNVPAEQAFLGAILANNKVYERVSDFLLPEHFADPVNARIYKAACDRIELGQLADAVTLNAEFEHAGILDEVGGTQYLTQLLSAMIGIINAGDYGGAIYDCWLRRQLIDLGEDVVNSAFVPESGSDGTAQVDAAAQRLADLSSGGRSKSSSATIKDAVAKAIEEGRSAASGEKVQALSTGFPSLDSAILGLRSGHLIIVGGRPGMGKTAMARSVAINVALGMGATEYGEEINDQGIARPVAYFSLEEQAADFGAAALAQISGVSVSAILAGDWAKNEKDAPPEVSDRRMRHASAIVLAQKRYSEAPLEVFDKPSQSLRSIVRDARAFKRRHKDLGLIVVDYLQLMPDPPGIKEKRLAVGYNGYGLKSLAKELDCAVVVLSQLGRQVEARNDKRPTMSDLRETGEIEDAADVIMFPYREEYYFAQTRPKDDGSQSQAAYQQLLSEWQEKLDRLRGRAEIIIPKVRRGEAPVYREMYFNGPRVRFEELRK